ncbi:MAG: hypothetical protein Q7S60_01475 [bacterium]|nr:hypothetical protein [bacterium]
MAKEITLDTLAGMIAKGFDENAEQHRQIFNRLDRIEMKLEGVVYRREFEELKSRIGVIENALAIDKKS